MSQLKKDTFYQRAKEKIKNKGLVYASAAVIAVSTGLVMSGRSCCGDGSAPMPQPMVEAPLRGDGNCDPSERYMYQLDAKSGAIKRDARGAPVPNPFYSKEDCFRNDGVCDNDSSKVLDQAGGQYQLHDPDGKAINYVQWRDGRHFNLPLEGETDVDCIMQLVREKGCAPLADGNRVYIDRPAVRSRLIVDGRPLTEPLVERSGDGQKILAYILPPTPYILRPMEGVNSVFWIHENPGSREHTERVRPGYNFEFMTYARDEVCPTDEAARTLQLCTPESITACICPNLRGCEQREPPPPRTCGNGRLDSGEQCDPRSKRARGGCQANHSCDSSCQCKQIPPTCGNSRLDSGEACDPPGSRCGTNGRCSSGCQCEEQPTCGNSALESGEACDPPGSSCGTNGTCSAACQCNERPVSVGPCKNTDSAEVVALKSHLSTLLGGAAAVVRDAHNPQDRARVMVSATVTFNATGGYAGSSVRSWCSGTCTNPTIDTASKVGDLGVSSTTIPGEGQSCTITQTRPASGQ